MSFIRAQQRTLTALFPHQANKKYLVPKRTIGPKILIIDFKTVSTTFTFDRDVVGGDATGWALEINAAPVAIISVINGATDDQIVVSYALQVVTDAIRITYDGTGTAWADSKGATLKRIDVSGVIV